MDRKKSFASRSAIARVVLVILALALILSRSCRRLRATDDSVSVRAKRGIAIVPVERHESAGHPATSSKRVSPRCSVLGPQSPFPQVSDFHGILSPHGGPTFDWGTPD